MNSNLREGLSVRHPTAADHSRVLAVMDTWWDNFGGIAGSQQRAALVPRLFFQHFTGTSYLVEEDGRLVAFLVGFQSQAQPDTGYIHFVGVEPPARRSGVAGWLYERFFIQALNSGASTIRCITSPGNVTSIAFHTGMGFDLEPGDVVRDGLPIHLDYDGPGLDRVSFVRDLSPAQ
ncbi:GNAT family N-acetyltransferase [Kocuria rosea]|uniref:GNAT family N-acetyltransferase n=1 Tax=Kocuria rosea TaxID=1275 RepID=UPI002B245626|nr:GNAT family N-acetyltransferase [Kocuria rosea]MEB2528658.1 GNAT family N-acetyltransferase [Kocuria rosea]MEB2620075.1 GNAT family N-acetyltransferase [Kocuria rosea]